MDKPTFFQHEDTKVAYIKSKDAESALSKLDTHPEWQAKLQTSDVLSGQYEGGFKIWESSLDLCRYLASPSNQIFVNDKRILELGCGAGLPGIVALIKNASHVCFQDLNQEVLDFWTKTNVELNGKNLLEKCSFISGDWSNFSETFQNNKFDVIVSSETIYNPNYYENLHDCLKNVLHPSGIALIAAKTYYFGCGGSIPSFISFVNEEKYFNVETVWSSATANVPRQILKLSVRQ